MIVKPIIYYLGYCDNNPTTQGFPAFIKILTKHTIINIPKIKPTQLAPIDPIEPNALDAEP